MCGLGWLDLGKATKHQENPRRPTFEGISLDLELRVWDGVVKLRLLAY